MKLWGRTDKGNIRAQNQDCYDMIQFDEKTALLLVCDGMGGAKAGNVASRLAADVFAGEVKRSWWPGTDTQEGAAALRSATELANQAVYEQAQMSSAYTGMGTTLVAALILGRTAVVSNVGDSRAYHLTGTGIRRISVDHSVVQMMVERGELTEEQARHYPGRNLITRAVGTEAKVACDIFTISLQPGDGILLCSDGLSNQVTDQEILFEVMHAVQKEHCCEKLIEIAKERGAPDNVTAVLAIVE